MAFPLRAEPPEETARVPALPAFEKDARILFQGDSITDGNRGRNQDPNHILGHGYAFLIAAKYGAAAPELNLTFLNRGVSGNTINDLAKRWQKETLDLKPTLLSVLVGINDTSRDLPLDQFEKEYDRLLTEAKESNPKLRLVLGEPFTLPSGPKKDGFEKWQASVKQRQEVVAKLAKKHGAGPGPLPEGLRRRLPPRRPTTGSGTESILLIPVTSSWPTSGCERSRSSGRQRSDQFFASCQVRVARDTARDHGIEDRGTLPTSRTSGGFMLKLATKFAPQPSAFETAYRAGFRFAELWLGPAVLADWQGVVRQARDYPIVYALYFPNKLDLLPEALEQTVSLYRGLEQPLPRHPPADGRQVPGSPPAPGARAAPGRREPQIEPGRTP